MTFDPNSPTFKRDPYPVYAAMRQETPIFYAEG